MIIYYLSNKRKESEIIERSFEGFKEDVKEAYDRYMKVRSEYKRTRSEESLQIMNKSLNLGYVKLQQNEEQALMGWYCNEYDEELIRFVREGNIEALQNFIANGKEGVCGSEQEAKEYLKNLRFDADAIATITYIDASGWSLLNAAASNGKVEMINFLIEEVGMDVDTICYGVTPAYCCLPSMHDKENNFNHERMEALKAFANKGADFSYQSTTSTQGSKASQLAIIHTASWIKDKPLRLEALNFITSHMMERDQDCNITDSVIGNAIDHLRLFSEDKETINILKKAGVIDSSVHATSTQAIGGRNVASSSQSVKY